ncbi:MAG: glycosyltransferase family 2 protein [Alphaproteobacteria bacterium]|nr:glycosyltransferase family 2 protein [Alphaproteobacteria bacterium]
MAERVIIAIPTCKRPKSLARLLDAIAALRTTADISVLVVDNDAEARQGFNLCRHRAPDYRWPLRAVIEPERGIAAARNRLVSEALRSQAQFIAMIDDDEWPGPNWITHFLETQKRTGADILQGSILFVRDRAGSGAVSDICHPTGPVDMLQGAGNLLIHRHVLEQTPTPWFDPAFGLTGGEDLDFFVRLKRAGFRFGWANEAVAFGRETALRQSWSWTARRAYSNGNSDMRVLLKHRQGAMPLALESLKIMGALLLSLPLALILGFSPNHRSAPLVMFMRAAGKLTAMLGLRYNEYALVHGE